MKHFRSLLMLGATLSLTILAACGTSTTSTGTATCTSKYDTTKMNLVLPGKLTIATDATYPPQEYTDPKTGTYAGMEIDLAKAIAADLCLTPVIQNVQFSTIISGITSGSAGSQYYDMSISAFTINSDRQKLVDMIPYFQAGESILVAPGNPKNIKTLSDLCGLAVAVEAGTVEHDEIAGTGDPKNPGLNETGGACAAKNVKLLTYDTQDKVISALLNGSADATYQDSPVTDYYAKLNPGKVQTGPVTVAPSPEGIVVRNDNAAFETAIKGVLSDLRTNGTYKQILNNWGMLEGAYPALP